MSISFEKSSSVFLLQAKNTTYAMQVSKPGYLLHVYWGKKVRAINPESVLVESQRNLSPVTDSRHINFTLDASMLEYPAYGNSDFRSPAFEVQFDDGTTVCAPVYKAHRIYAGKPKLEGLPATYTENDSEADTLEIELEDEKSGLLITLLYTAYNDLDVITRSARIKNGGDENVRLSRALSMSVDMPHADFDLITLSGSWARERHIDRRALNPGMQSVESRRGASGHQQSPFAALASKNADEKNGEVYAASLVYSGNFISGAEVDQYKTTRLFLGINPFDFCWLLEPGQTFTTPEAVMVYSDSGFGKMSRTFHKLYRERLCRGKFRDKTRPVLVNNWEATFFDFNSDKIKSLAKAAGKLGIELFVLDDGWFGKRNTDTTSLGDWFVNKEKLPEGLAGLAEAVNKEGMEFGLWVEPEMVSPESELYKKHPDWCLHVDGRSRTQSRYQLVLDMTREDVRDYLFKTLSDVLSSAPIRYIKWDMNRNITEAHSALLPRERQKEVFHRYILGLYALLEKLTGAFPDVLFESCASGGGRFDAGMLYYMPQTWTSDDTDAVERLKIQYGTSLVFPASTMGAHVAQVPNQQCGRVTPLCTRGNTAMSGNFGYELDLEKLSEKELDVIKKQIAAYKEIRNVVQFGDMYRLKDPFSGNSTAWIFVSPDKSEAFAACFSVLSIPNAPVEYIRFDGLDPESDYTDKESGVVFGGDVLMNTGIPIPNDNCDFQSHVWHFVKK